MPDHERDVVGEPSESVTRIRLLCVSRQQELQGGGSDIRIDLTTRS